MWMGPRLVRPTLSVSRTTIEGTHAARDERFRPSAKRRVERARSGGREVVLSYGYFDVPRVVHHDSRSTWASTLAKSDPPSLVRRSPGRDRRSVDRGCVKRGSVKLLSARAGQRSWTTAKSSRTGVRARTSWERLAPRRRTRWRQKGIGPSGPGSRTSALR